jgi:TetR/AcrR family transcriptional regulator
MGDLEGEHTEPKRGRPERVGHGQLLQIAEILFARCGFDGVSIAEIAAVADVSKATVMHHFVTKKRLYGAVLQRIADSLEALIADLPRDDRWFLAFVDRYLEWALARPAWSIVLLRELVDNAERAETANRWFLRSLVRRLIARVRLSQRRGAIMPGPPALPVETLFGTVSYHLAARPTEQRLFGTAAAHRFEVALPAGLRDALARGFLTPRAGRA